MSNPSYQGIGPRLVAQIVDTVVLSVLFLLVGFALSGSFTFEYQGEAAYPFLSAYGLTVLLYFDSRGHYGRNLWQETRQN
jgi:hypothetical protein